MRPPITNTVRPFTLNLRQRPSSRQTVIPAELLHFAQQGKAECLSCFMTGMELLYRVWRDEGEAAGRLAREQFLAS